MSSLTQRIAALPPEKRALLTELLAQRRGQPGDRIRPRESASTRFPLSYAQQRLWFLNQLEPESHSYNIHMALRLVGALNVVALEASLTEIIRRHEALRTTIVTVDDEPLQVIAPPTPITLTVRNLSRLSKTRRETAVVRLATEEAQRPFDLAQGPLFRASLLRLSPKEYALLLTVHHIVFDEWSLGILTRELEALYTAYVAGAPAQLPGQSIQYADYAVWQRNWLMGDVLQSQLAYWKQQLAGVPNHLNLQADYPRPLVQTFRGARHPFALSADVVDALKALGKREGASLFMILLAAFQAVLYRSTGQADLVVGTPASGRTRSEAEHVIGFFLNMLPLRADLSGNPRFTELLRRVREVCLGAFTHQDLPFERLVEELRLARDLSRTPLIQAVLDHHNVPTNDVRLPEVAVQPIHIDSEIAKFDLSLTTQETRDGLIGVAEYNTDLFEAKTVERLLGYYCTLLARIAAVPRERIDELLSDSMPLGAPACIPRSLPLSQSVSQHGGTPSAAPHTAVEAELAHIWEEVLGISPIGIEDDFFVLGGTSLTAVRLMTRIRKQIGHNIPLAALFQGATVRGLAQSLQQSVIKPPSPHLVAIQPQGTRRPLFGVHPVGGGVLCYADLANALGPEQPFYGLQAEDLTEAGDLEISIEQMAADYIEGLRTVQPTGPYLLCGWSFGGMVAFEMAQQLHRRGHDVELLALLDTNAPSNQGNRDNLTDAMVLAVLAKEQADVQGKALSIALGDLQQLLPDDQLRHVLERIKRAGLDMGTELEWVQRFLKGYKARVRALEAYKPQVYPSRITFIRSTRQSAGAAQAAALMGTHVDTAIGWEAFTTHPLDICDIPAPHHLLAAGANASLVAAHLRAHMT